MRTVDLILRKRGGEELSVEEIQYLVNGYTTGEIPDYQMAAFLMATYFSGMTDRELSALTESMMATGEMVGAIAMTEPGTGSDLQAVKTTAKKQGNSYVINGQKTFISNGQAADLVIVVARTGGPGAKGLSLFVGPGFQLGLEFFQVKDGQRVPEGDDLH